MHPSSTSYPSFFIADVKPQLDQHRQTFGRQLAEVDVTKVYVGKSKDLLDVIDIDLVIADVAPLFGHFVKYEVRQTDDSEVSFVILSLQRLL